LLTKSLANPSPATADPIYLSVAQSRPVASPFAYSYSTSNLNHTKSQNQGVYSHGDRNRRKQNSRPPRMFNRGPLNNTTNVVLEKPYASVPKPQVNSALSKTPAPNVAMYKSKNNPRNAAVNREPVQPSQEPNNAVPRFKQQEGDAPMTNSLASPSHPHIIENTTSLKAVFQGTKKEIAAPEPLASTFLRNFLGRPLPFNIHDNAEADYVAHLISILSDPHSRAAKLLIDWSPAFVLRLQQFVLVRSQGAAVEEIAKQAKERCAGYMNACKEGANPAGGRAWLAARELKKPQPPLHKHVLLEQHRKKLGCIGSHDFVDMLV
jgi:hypothetical protein